MSNVKEDDFWVLISRDVSVGYSSDTYAKTIQGVGTIVRVTTLYSSEGGTRIAEALTFVPESKIKIKKDAEGKVVKKTLTYW